MKRHSFPSISADRLPRLINEIKSAFAIPKPPAKAHEILSSYSYAGKVSEKDLKKITAASSNLCPLFVSKIKLLKNSQTKELICSEESPSPLLIFQGLRPNGYYCYQTALHCLGYTKSLPTLLYQANERPSANSAKHQYNYDDSKLREEFSKPARYSNNTASFKKYKTLLLEREYTASAGVVEVKVTNDLSIKTTCAERTLIDCAASPHYCDGPLNVLNIYKKLSEFNVDRLIEIYRAMTFSYPYWQRIGFYIEKSGGDANKIRQIKSTFGVPKNHFYLDKEFGADWIFSEDWKISYPDVFI